MPNSIGAGMNLDWFWRGWYLENLELDQAIASVKNSRRENFTDIEIVNLGAMVMPVELLIEFEDGSEVEESLPVRIWHYTNRWSVSVDTSGKPIKRVRLDPTRRLPDSVRTNNAWEPVVPTEGEADKEKSTAEADK